jgi:DUF1365 family protein
MSSALYRGSVTHARRDVYARRTFRYPLYVASLDLDELAALDRSLRLFSYNRRNLFALRDIDYEAGAIGLAASHAALLAGNGLPAPATTRLVTNLRVAGYVFNPVSFFLGYDVRGDLQTAIAEVNNTYGGRRRYVLGPDQRLPGPRVGFRHTRELFVSPFLHGPATYDFWFDTPLDGPRSTIDMHVTDAADKRILTARLEGDRQSLDDRALLSAALRYPLMTAQVIALIHLEALKLRFARVPYRRPGADHDPHPAL